MRARNQCRLRIEELERRETPSGMTITPFFPHNPGFPQSPPNEPAGQTDEHPAPIPMATGTFLARVSVSDLSGPVTIDFQAGAHFETTIDAGGLQVDLKGELNQAQGTVHFDCTIWSNGEKVGTASGEGTYVDPCPTCRGQIDSFAVNFTFTMADGSAGSGSASLQVPPT